jgi:hypothetical protein
MKLNIYFSDLYWHLARQGHPQEFDFEARQLPFHAKFAGNTLQINLQSGEPFATVVNGETKAYETDYRHVIW